jgi:hypothetical protein
VIQRVGDSGEQIPYIVGIDIGATQFVDGAVAVAVGVVGERGMVAQRIGCANESFEAVIGIGGGVAEGVDCGKEIAFRIVSVLIMRLLS